MVPFNVKLLPATGVYVPLLTQFPLKVIEEAAPVAVIAPPLLMFPLTIIGAVLAVAVPLLLKFPFIVTGEVAIFMVVPAATVTFPFATIRPARGFGFPDKFIFW